MPESHQSRHCFTHSITLSFGSDLHLLTPLEFHSLVENITHHSRSRTAGTTSSHLCHMHRFCKSDVQKATATDVSGSTTHTCGCDVQFAPAAMAARASCLRNYSTGFQFLTRLPLYIQRAGLHLKRWNCHTNASSACGTAVWTAPVAMVSWLHMRMGLLLFC